MADARPPAGGQTVNRVAARLASPPLYLAVLGSVQLVVLWLLQAHFGTWLPLLTSVALGLVLALVALLPDRWLLKLWAVAGLSFLTAVVPVLFEVIRRPRIGLTVEHDGMLQVESAIDRVLSGQQIYGVDWSATPLGSLPWDLTPGGNPALHHFAYLPLTVLVGIPFRLVSRMLGLPFDYRTVLVAFVVIGLVAIVALPQSPQRRIMLLTAVFISPLITLYLWSGRNDVEFLAMLLVCLAVLSRAHPVGATAALGLGLALKPFAWPAVPLLLLMLLLRWRRYRDRRELILGGLALLAPPLLTIAPFFLANPAAFIGDVILYTSGGGPDAYPIAGYGFGELLYNAHLISHRTDAFPFALFQVAAMAPVLWLVVRAFHRRPTARQWLAGYAWLLLAFCFFARFFNDNYAAVVITLFLCLPALDDAIGLAAAGRRPALPRAA
jgi:hypothetical protein